MSLAEKLRELIFGKYRTAPLVDEETRESPRHSALLLSPYLGEGPLVARRGNLGIGGALIEGEQEFIEGDLLELTFRLPGSPRWIRAKAEVLGFVDHADCRGLRCRFTDLEFEDERSIARWLDNIRLSRPS